MKSSELADAVRRAVQRSSYAVLLGSEESGEIGEKAAARILGVGDEQYSEGETQKFETMSLDDLFQYLDEELLDQINYAVMLQIRLQGEADITRLGRYSRLMYALDDLINNAQHHIITTRRKYSEWKAAEVQA